MLDGDASPDWARAAVQAIVDVLPAGRRQTLAGQSHAVEPDPLVPALTAFFAA